MRQTLFYIPETVAGLPLFGVGLLLLVWAVASAAFMAWLIRRQGLKADTWGYLPILAMIGAVIAFVLPVVSHAGRGLPIRGYGVMMLLGVVAGTGLTVYRARRLGIHPDFVLSLIFWGFLPGILGARLFYVIQYWSDYQRETLSATLGAIANIPDGGLVVYGSLIGGLGGFAVFVLREKAPLLATMDLVTPGMLIGLALGRIGCLLNGCCHGGPCELPWAVCFPQGSPPYFHQFEHGVLSLDGLTFHGEAREPAIIHDVKPGAPAAALGLKAGQRILAVNDNAVATLSKLCELLIESEGRPRRVRVEGLAAPVSWPASPLPSVSEPVHPTQIYSAVDAMVLCLFLLAYDAFRRRDGELIALLLTLYPINRFLMELIRTDEPGRLGTGLTIGQLVSLGLLACAAALWIHLLRRPPGKAFPLRRHAV